MEVIWITGDTHGDWIHRLNMDSFPEQREMTKDDYVIVLGDLGYGEIHHNRDGI